MTWPTKKLGEVIKKVIENIERSPTKLFIGLLVFLISSSIIIINGASFAWNLYHQNVQWKQRSYELIGSLAADVNVGYFESKLGRAAFINVADKANKKEYVFVNENYYVDAITDKNGRILMYSVTIRNKNFNPTSPDEKIVLGKSRFIDLVNDEFFGEPIEVISWLGAHDGFYTEGYYWGNPMNYQIYYYSNSDAGFNNYDNSGYVVNPNYFPDYIENGRPKTFAMLMDEEVSGAGPEYKKNGEIMEFRKRNTNIINTYTVTAPFITIGEMADYFKERDSFYFLGPDKNQVRLAP